MNEKEEMKKQYEAEVESLMADPLIQKMAANMLANSPIMMMMEEAGIMTKDEVAVAAAQTYAMESGNKPKFMYSVMSAIAQTNLKTLREREKAREAVNEIVRDAKVRGEG